MITDWNTSSAQNYSHIFSGCLDFNKPLRWDTSNAVDMSRMVCRKEAMFKSAPVQSFLTDPLFVPLQFENAKKFNQDLSFDTSGVANMDGMCKFYCFMLVCSGVPILLILFIVIAVCSSCAILNSNLILHYSSSRCQELQWRSGLQYKQCNLHALNVYGCKNLYRWWLGLV